jgi:hypothetical protein
MKINFKEAERIIDWKIFCRLPRMSFCAEVFFQGLEMKMQNGLSKVGNVTLILKKSLFFNLIFLLVLAGCISKEKDETEYDIRTTIGRYNNAVITAYKSLNIGPLNSVTTEEQLIRVDSFIGAFLQRDQIMESELHRMDFEDVKIDSDKATVRTTEDWSYRWIDSRTGEEVEPLKEIHYEMRYHLKKIDDKWLVEKVEEVGEGVGG